MAVRYGYVRVSTAEQNEERQIKAIKGYAPDIPIENIFVDKISGKKYDRPNYLAMKQLIINVKNAYSNLENPPIIEVIIEELDRLGRTKQGILEELKWFADNNVIVRILEIPTTLADVGEGNEWVMELSSRIVIEVYTTIAEQEMDKRVKRQAEGIAIAKAQGKYKGRKPIEVQQALFVHTYDEWKSGCITARQAMKQLNLKPNTFYRRVHDYEEKNNLKVAIN